MYLSRAKTYLLPSIWFLAFLNLDLSQMLVVPD